MKFSRPIRVLVIFVAAPGAACAQESADPYSGAWFIPAADVSADGQAITSGGFYLSKTPAPLTGVTFAQAEAFARGAGLRVPTALEWERARTLANLGGYPWAQVDGPSERPIHLVIASPADLYEERFRRLEESGAATLEKELGELRAEANAGDQALASKLVEVEKTLVDLRALIGGYRDIMARKSEVDQIAGEVAKVDERLDLERERLARIDAALVALEADLARKVEGETHASHLEAIQGRVDRIAEELRKTDAGFESELARIAEDASRARQLLHYVGRELAVLFAANPSREPALPPAPGAPAPEGPVIEGPRSTSPEEAISSRVLVSVGKALLAAGDDRPAARLLATALELAPADEKEGIERLLRKIRSDASSLLENMVYVGAYDPEGRLAPIVARVGSWDGASDEGPMREVEVAPFYIDRHEVTNAEFRAWCDATGRSYPDAWPDGRVPLGEEQHPVTGVAFEDAMAFARDEGKTLPTEAQWETAARAADARVYPWGNDPPILVEGAGGSRQFRANFDPGARVSRPYVRTAPVSSLSAGASPFGALHMAGNVAEWTRTRNWGASEEAYIVKGGSWQDAAFFIRAAARRSLGAAETERTVGFRCAFNPGARGEGE